jgi:hypothetical protein
MAKKEPSETEGTPLPAQETPLPELQVEVVPEEEAAAAAVQEAEKPDLTAQLEALPKEERDALLERVWPDRLESARQSGRDSAARRLQEDRDRQIQANQGLQETLKNLDTADDDSKRAGHLEAYAGYRIRLASQQQAQEALENVREALGVPDAEHDELVYKLHREAVRDNRVATLADYIKHVTGERFMPKRESDAKIRAEVNAALEERLGRQRETEPAPVSVGQGQPAGGRNPEQKWIDEGSPSSGPIYDEYMGWRKERRI